MSFVALQKLKYLNCRFWAIHFLSRSVFKNWHFMLSASPAQIVYKIRWAFNLLRTRQTKEKNTWNQRVWNLEILYSSPLFCLFACCSPLHACSCCLAASSICFQTGLLTFHYYREDSQGSSGLCSIKTFAEKKSRRGYYVLLCEIVCMITQLWTALNCDITTCLLVYNPCRNLEFL